MGFVFLAFLYFLQTEMKKEFNSSRFNVCPGNNVNLCAKGEFHC